MIITGCCASLNFAQGSLVSSFEFGAVQSRPVVILIKPISITHFICCPITQDLLVAILLPLSDALSSSKRWVTVASKIIHTRRQFTASIFLLRNSHQNRYSPAFTLTLDIAQGRGLQGPHAVCLTQSWCPWCGRAECCDSKGFWGTYYV